MTNLTEDQRKKIVEEEQLRAQARHEAEQKNKPKMTNAAGCLILFIILPVFFFLWLAIIR